MTTTTTTLTPRQKRAMSDARCAWRAMTETQRAELLRWYASSDAVPLPSGTPILLRRAARRLD